MAVVIGQIEANLPSRPDDAAGEGFARQLAAMKRRVARRNEPPITRPDYQWILEDIEPGAAQEWQMSASPPGYYLLALKLKEDFLARQSLDSPRISWSVYRTKNDSFSLIMGGQAPTWQVAQVRAEAIWRIVANIRADS